MKKRLFLESGLISLLSAENAIAQKTASDEEDEYILNFLRENGLEKFYFFSSKNGEKLVEKFLGAGLYEDPAIGSVSKSITGIAIAILIQEKKIALDSKIDDFLVEFFGRKSINFDSSLKNLTIRRLLTHTAGLRPNYSTDPVNGINNYSVYKKFKKNPDQISYLIESDGYKSNGSNVHLYSNISYLLLSLVVESVSGVGFYDFCYKKIFDPLGIKSAKVYQEDIPLSGFSDWRISCSDLSKVWGNFVKNDKEKLLTNKTIDELFLSNIGFERDDGVRYTSGVYSKSSPDLSRYAIWHNGLYSFWPNSKTFLSYSSINSDGYFWCFSISNAPKSKELSNKIINYARSMAKK